MKTIFTICLCLGQYFVNAQWISDTLQIEGYTRTFHYQTPAKELTNGAIVFVLHGSGGNGKELHSITSGFDAIAKKENVLFVYPDAYDHFWNECRKAATSKANQLNINEGAFFKGMIDHLCSKYKLNKEKVACYGFSGGGHMAYKLALTAPSLYKAIAAIASSLPAQDNLDCTPVNKPVAIMIVNGTNDGVSPFNGGAIKAENVTLGHVRSTMETFQYFAAVNGYRRKPTVEIIPAQMKVEKLLYKKGKRPMVQLYIVHDGGHDIPSAFDSLTAAWNFFKQSF